MLKLFSISNGEDAEVIATGRSGEVGHGKGSLPKGALRNIKGEISSAVPPADVLLAGKTAKERLVFRSYSALFLFSVTQ